MKITEFFDSRDKKKRLSHVRNLIAIACADGSLDKSEISLISTIGQMVGITQEELKRIFNHPQSISFYMPETYKEKLEQIYDMVMVMMVDGQIHERERKLCELFVEKLGLFGIQIDIIILNINVALVEGYSFDSQIMRLLNYLEEEN
jgi:uncharacterized tellurite resistance protein B-like protein